MRWLLIVGAVLAFAPTASAGMPNPCGLLTNTQVAKALGSKVVARDELGNNLYRSCKWTGQNLAKAGFYATQRTLSVTVSRSTKAEFEQVAKRERTAVRVHGVGESAFRLSMGGTGLLNVWQDGYSLELVANLVTSPLTVEKKAASAALKRLTG